METSSLIQLLSSTALFASSIFIPLMAEGFGGSVAVVGIIVGAYNATYLLSNYIFGLLSEKYGGKRILTIGLFFSGIAFALQLLARDIASLLALRLLAGAAAGIFPAALAVYAYSEHGGKMGRFTGFGSLGWSIGAVLAGLISNNYSLFAMSAIFFGIAFFLSLQVEEEKKREKRRVKLLPFGLIFRNARLYIPFFFRLLGAQAIWSIFPLYLVSTGADRLWIGIAYFVNTFSHYFIMQYVERYKNLYLVNIGLLLSVFTFMGYALFPHLPIVLVFQLLLAASFSTLAVGTIQELLSKNVEQSMAVGLLNSIANFTAVIGPFLAGAIAQQWGFPGVMWTGAALAFVGLISFTTVLE